MISWWYEMDTFSLRRSCACSTAFLLHFWWGDNKPTTKLWTDKYGDTVLHQEFGAYYVLLMAEILLTSWYGKNITLFIGVLYIPGGLAEFFSINSSRPFLIHQILEPDQPPIADPKEDRAPQPAEWVSSTRWLMAEIRLNHPGMYKTL